MILCPYCNTSHIPKEIGELTVCLNLRESAKDEPIWLSREAMRDMNRLREENKNKN